MHIKDQRQKFRRVSQGTSARKVIAVAYTLRTYWNQFSLDGLKQEKMYQCSVSIRGG